MRTWRTNKGPFTERPYFDLAEIEAMCADELHKVQLYPAKPSPIRIDRFIEKRFGVSHEYDNLPQGILGYTRFGAKGVEKIVVTRSLSEEDSRIAERRINTTLAHEAGHGLLHAYLVAVEEKPMGLFEYPEEDRPRILCRNITGDIKPRYSGNWWEHQANLAMGALLLPRSLIGTALEPFMLYEGNLGMKNIDRSKREEAILALSEIFDVNPIVARIRVEEIHPECAQLRL